MQQSGLWKHGLLITLLFGFSVMIVGGVLMYRSRAPIPERVISPAGETLFTAADIQNGQDLFRKRGLMDYGTVLGHGAYLGPDYTAEALHWMTETMRRYRAPNYDALSAPEKAAVDSWAFALSVFGATEMAVPVADQTLSTVLKYPEDEEMVRRAGLAAVIGSIE